MLENMWLIILGMSLLAGILSGIPVMLILAGVPVVVAFVASAFGAFDLSFLQAYPQRAFGVMQNSLLIAVPLFVLMGVLLERSRVAERTLMQVSRLLGGSPRALALSVLLIATLIAASTGIIGATIVMLAMISLPAMRRVGVPDATSSGLICAAGTLGQIIPPSIVLILLGDQVANAYLDAQQRAGNFAPDAVTVGDLFAGALVPGLVLVLLYGIFISFRLARVPAEAVDTDPKIGLWDVMREVLPPILLILAVLGSILAGVATPTEAAAIGVAGTLLITAARVTTASDAASQPDGTAPRTPEKRRSPAWLRHGMTATAVAGFALVILRLTGVGRINLSSGELTLGGGSILALGLTALVVIGLSVAVVTLTRSGVFGAALGEAAKVSGMIFGIILAASMLSLVFRGFGGDDWVHALLTNLPGDHTTMLIFTLLVIFAMGFILEFIEIVFIVIPLVGPILLQDVDPVWFAVLVALNLQTSFLTPPFGFALFYFRSAAPEEITTSTIYRAVVPFILIQVVTLGIVFLWPPLATWLPQVLFG
ncbi:tripartite ATP-independent transporter DctM subunit [Aliiruegeria haliotis]|uniref:Tripartite ATP-independent transporter DctM subunit n=1 Tax=Aliiruegeria haliotis TaxID=1280846 RepID=A0A2T0RV99_9RHOB|nr:TRAP transporter large permease subunit [Aliiruegeria haliotis]PRY25126.1 tripartite ATP-independent transporter DctM subunit [Aliiruegeria haliotis]